MPWQGLVGKNLLTGPKKGGRQLLTIGCVRTGAFYPKEPYFGEFSRSLLIALKVSLEIIGEEEV